MESTEVLRTTGNEITFEQDATGIGFVSAPRHMHMAAAAAATAAAGIYILTALATPQTMSIMIAKPGQVRINIVDTATGPATHDAGAVLIGDLRAVEAITRTPFLDEMDFSQLDEIDY